MATLVSSVPCPFCFAQAGFSCPAMPAGEFHSQRIELANMEDETAPGKAPGREAFVRAAFAADLF